jgi:hypothetical protein
MLTQNTDCKQALSFNIILYLRFFFFSLHKFFLQPKEKPLIRLSTLIKGGKELSKQDITI